MTDYETYWAVAVVKFDPFVLDCILPYLCNVLTYTLLNVPFLILDIYGRPKSLLKYKVQPKEKSPSVPINVLKSYVGACLFNVFILGFCLHSFMYTIRKWSGYSVHEKLPSAFVFTRDIILFILLEEFLFYYTHRLFHLPYFYKRIHKKHHEWTSPIALASRYCHPIEHLISYDGPFMLGPVLLGSHTVTYSVWSIIAVTFQVAHHSGYKIPLLPSPEFHDYHHEKFVVNFGIFGLFDILHGTQAFYVNKLEEDECKKK